MENSIGAKRKAQELVRKGQIQEAIERMRSVLDEGDPDPYDHVYVGDLLMRVGEHTEAINVYMVAVRSYESVGLYRNAIAIGKKILRTDKTRADVHRRLADLYDREGLNGEAMPHYLSYLDSFSGDALPPSEFLETLDRAAESVGSKAEVALRLAEHFARVKRGDRAAQLLESVADLLESDGTEDMAEGLRARARDLAGPSGGAGSGDQAERGIDQVEDLGSVDLSLPETPDAGDSDDLDVELLSLEEDGDGATAGHDAPAPMTESPPISVSLDSDEVRAALDFGTPTKGVAGPPDASEVWDPTARDMVAPPVPEAEDEAASSGSAGNGRARGDQVPGSGFVVEHFPSPGTSDADTGTDGDSDSEAVADDADAVAADSGDDSGDEADLSLELDSASTPAEVSLEDDDEEKIWEIDDSDLGLEPLELVNEDADLSQDDGASVSVAEVGAENTDASAESSAEDTIEPDAPESVADSTGPVAASRERLTTRPPAGSKIPPRPVLRASGSLDAEVEERLRGGLSPSKQAESAMARGRWAEALTLLQELHHDDSQNTSTLSKLVEVCKHLGDRDAQVRYLCLLGDVWISRTELEEALDTFLAVMRIDPENATAKRRLSRFRELGVDGAETQIEKMGASTGSLLHTGMTQVAVRDDAEFRNEDWVELEGLLAEFKDGLKNQMDESDYQGHYDLAVSHHSMGLLEESIEELDRVLSISDLPEDMERQARELKGSCFMGLCQWREAVHEFREALDKSGGDEQGRRSSLYHLGQALESVGEWQEASERYQQLVSEAPGFLDVDERLQYCQTRSEDDSGNSSSNAA